MSNSFYQLEIIADPTAAGEVFTKTEVIKKDLLMTSRRIALFKFEKHFEALQTEELQKTLEEEGCGITGDTTIFLSLYLIHNDPKAKKTKNLLLQRVQTIPSENLDFDMELLEAEQDAVAELLKEGKLPHERPVGETHFYRQIVWKVNGDKKKVIDINDYPFEHYKDAYFNSGYKSNKKIANSSFSELFLVEKIGQQQKEYLLTRGDKRIFGIGFIIEKDAHWKYGFEQGITGWFGNRGIPKIYPGKLDRNIYSWIELK